MKFRQDHQYNQFSVEKNPWWYNAIFPLYLIITLIYLVWRYEITLSTIVIWYSLPLLIIEIYNGFTNITHLLVTRKIVRPIWSPPLENKTVDIFIPTYNEPEEIIEMTALGAMNIKGIRNIYILDDGNRATIKNLAKTLGVHYGARGKNTHAKAGNMNYGLSLSDAEFVIFVDCDHVPQPNFIERTLGYFKDPKLAFVQTPQVFYNTDSFQFRKLPFRNLWNEQTMFYESIQPAKNMYNAGFFCGSGAILRRAALDSVGGFATGTATEDIHTSLKLHAKKWNSIYLEEKLAFGLAPEDLKEYHDQRVRWGAGSLGLMLRTKDSPFIKRGLSFMQRICYFNSTNAYFYGGIIKLFYFSLPLILLLTLPFQSRFQSVYTLQYMAVFIPFLILSYFVTYLYSRKTFHIIFTEQYNIANIFSCIAALKGIIKVQKKFKVSLKSKMLKENHIAYFLIFGLLAIMLATDIFGILYWFIILKKNLSDFFMSQVFISLFWNTYNAILVFSLFDFINSYNKKKHHEHPFFSYKKTQVKVGNLIGTLHSISLRGAYVILDSIPNNQIQTFSLVSSDYPLSITSEVVSTHKLSSGKLQVNLKFKNVSVKNKQILISFIFNELVSDLFNNDFKIQHVASGVPNLAI